MKLNLKKFIKKEYDSRRDELIILTLGKLDKAFNDFICELQTIVKEGEKYSNVNFWRKPYEIKFERIDKKNIDMFKKKMLDGGTVDQDDIDYFAGKGIFSENGLINYMEDNRVKKFSKILSELSYTKKEFYKSFKEIHKEIYSKENLKRLKNLNEKEKKKILNIVDSKIDI